jgi:SagB-type dehydrogenase family enzyme
MSKRSVSEIYHQETKYSEEGIQKQQRQLDWSAQPSPFKSYHSDRKVDLIPYLPFQTNPFTGEAVTPPPDEGKAFPFGLGEISRLLYFTNGVTGILQYPTGESLYLRASPTAGGLYPTEIYVATRDLSSLENGIYNFQVKDHSLVPVWEGNFWQEFEQYLMAHEAVAQSQLLLIFTAVYNRSAWRYQERAYRRILLDTGHVLGNLVAYAAEEGFVPYPIGGFYDAALNRLLFLDDEEEGTILAVALPRASSLREDEIRHSSVYPSSPAPGELDRYGRNLIMQIHRASSIQKGETLLIAPPHPLSEMDGRYQNRPSLPLSPVPIEWEDGIGQTILIRRSTRAFSAEPFLKEELGSILAFSYQFISEGRLQFHFDPSLIDTYVVAHRVLGMEPGVYYYAPLSQELRTIQGGDLRQQTWHFCLGQELGRDAAALVLHVTHLPRAIERYGDRAYRYLHLDAGHIGQRMNLAAMRMGLGASGIGGFFDDEINEMLGLSLDQITVYITTLGRPREGTR